MQITNADPFLNIQNQLVQNQVELVKVAVQTEAMIDSSNLNIIAPDIEQALKEQVLMPIAYQATQGGQISITNAPSSAIVDILA